MLLQPTTNINGTHIPWIPKVLNRKESIGNITFGVFLCSKEKTMLCSIWPHLGERQNKHQPEYYPDRAWWKAFWLHRECSKFDNSKAGLKPDLCCSATFATWKPKLQNFSKMTEWRIFLKTVLAVLPFPTTTLTICCFFFFLSFWLF